MRPPDKFISYIQHVKISKTQLNIILQKKIKAHLKDNTALKQHLAIMRINC